MHRTTLLALLFTLGLGAATPALAGDTNPECLGSSCGKPKEEGGGGGCGCGCGCSVWVAYTDDGKTLAYTDDADGDGKADDTDNCPFASNRDQLDGDGDGVGSACDNCAALQNYSQLDTNGDGEGDVCDADLDGDGRLNLQDNCPGIPNPDQKVIGHPGLGVACDPDDDADGVLDVADNCPEVGNPDQSPVLLTSGGPDPRCNVDTDGDNIGDSRDNCPLVRNSQSDLNGNGIGDACDSDIDGDGILNVGDNCSSIPNRTQLDDDGDALGDVCDTHYCVVIDQSNPADCLDPNLPFRVHAGGIVTLRAGEKFRLPLFANRNGAAIEYTWTVEGRPAGSKAAVLNPQGVVTMSRHWAYAYQDGSVPTFTADVDGEYSLQLQAHLAFSDRAYPDQKDSVSTLKLNTIGGGTSTSCAAVPVDASLAAMGLAVLALIRRRR